MHHQDLENTVKILHDESAFRNGIRARYIFVSTRTYYRVG